MTPVHRPLLLALALTLQGAAILHAQARVWPPNPAVDTIFAQYGATTPGCALGVMRDGAIVYARGYGMANLEHDIPITPASVFHVASVSKQFTALAITMLARDGKLSLDDDIRRHLPELHDFGKRITVRHLLHHTSGLRDQWTLFSLAGWRAQDLKSDADVVQLAVRQRELNFEPGAEHLYSNTGYTLLGEIVRRVTGQSLRAWTSAQLFAPLGMHHTHFHDDYNMLVKQRADGYSPLQNGFRVSNPAYSTVGATSLFTTVEDMALWDRNFYDRRVGGGAVDTLHTRGRLNDGQEIAYAFALMHSQYRGVRAVGHSGSDAGYRSQYTRFPDERLAIVVLCNVSTANPGALVLRVADVYLASRVAVPPPPVTTDPEGLRVPAPVPPVLTPAQMQALLGDYYSDELNTTYTIALSGDALVVRRWRFEDQPLRAGSNNTFSGPGGTYSFVRDSSGNVTGFLITAGRVRNVRFERQSPR